MQNFISTKPVSYSKPIELSFDEFYDRFISFGGGGGGGGGGSIYPAWSGPYNGADTGITTGAIDASYWNDHINYGGSGISLF